MLGINLGEIVAILVVAIIVLKPEDIPGLLRTAGKMVAKFQAFSREITDALHGTIRETGIHEVQHEMTEIIDLEGKPQQAYDVTKIEELKR